MQPKSISSVKNPLVARFREAAAGDPPEVMLVEGVKLCFEALDAQLPFLEAAVSPRLVANARGLDLRRRLERDAPSLSECSDAVMDRISSVQTHQGVAAIVRRPAYQMADLTASGAATSGPALVLVAAGVKDPGNLGALVRTAEAAGASGLIALAGGADPFREKAVRGSAGSVFRLPTLGNVSAGECLRLVEQASLDLLIADSHADAHAGGRDYLELDLRRPCALVLGGEGEGVAPLLRERAKMLVRVPMAPTVESLNVAVAAGVLLYEARRQRLHGRGA